ncbi:MAG: SIMPL domain-containing protein [Chloroflexota bacterium]
MNTKLIAILILALALILALSAWTGRQSDTPDASRTITVTGDADVRVVPDEVILTLGIETWDKNLRNAKRQNDERVKAVLELARQAGIESRHIQTDLISIEPRYEDNYEKEDLIGYFVRKTIVITLKDIAKFEELLTSVLEANVNYVHGIQFRTTELRRHRDQARALAIQAAREKAEALAGELGETLGRPRTIQEDSAGWWSWYGYSWWGSHWNGGMAQNVIQEVGGNNLADSDGAIAPGQITVNAKVTVNFELE